MSCPRIGVKRPALFTPIALLEFPYTEPAQLQFDLTGCAVAVHQQWAEHSAALAPFHRSWKHQPRAQQMSVGVFVTNKGQRDASEVPRIIFAHRPVGLVTADPLWHRLGTAVLHHCRAQCTCDRDR